MPRMVYVKGVGRVRAGSWSTKPVTDQWKLTQKQLEDASLLMVARLDYLLFKEGSEFSRAYREAYDQNLIWQLEGLREQVNELLAKFPKARRATALENVSGRTPEEAAAFKAKARAIREGM